MRLGRWGLLVPAIVAAACGRSGTPGANDADLPTPSVPASPTPTGSPQAFCETSGVIACWRFEDDLVDEGPLALVISGGGIDFDDGAVGEAVALDLNSFLTLPGKAAWVTSTSAISFEAWIEPDPLPTSRYGIIDRANGGGYSLFLYPNGTVRCGSRALVYASNAAPEDSWTHVACVDDGANTSIWIDGAFVAQAPGAGLLVMSTSAQKVYLGENGPEGNDQFLGELDEIRFLDRVLTSAEILASFERRP